MQKLSEKDIDIFNTIKNELKREEEGLEMIPSENNISPAVMQAMGSIFNNKYSEGYSHKRYYGGQEFVDKMEDIAVERAKKLFGTPHANIQPYSGSPANLAVYLACCEPGDTIMGLNLEDGGHLTHGFKVSATGKFYNSISYHLTAEGYTDLDEVRRLAREHKPKLIWCGATAYPREIPFKEFAEIATEVGAYLAADIAHIAGLVIGGVHVSPSEFADVITTTTHKTLRGPRGGMILVTNKGLLKDKDLAKKIDGAVFPGLQGGPHDHINAGKAVAFGEALKPEFKEYAKQIVLNSKALAQGLMDNDIKLISNGTDNHLCLIDLTPFGNGKGLFVQEALDEAGITVNKNTIPKEPFSPFYPSGIRLGTPSLTTRGMKENEMLQIANIISEIIKLVAVQEMSDDKEERMQKIKEFNLWLKENTRIKELREEVKTLATSFPIYPGYVLE
ncbi:MAG: serine hydroxymethyltransferase [archaeon]